jgi:EAL domain-containing protein (putative c-di-GMP-specific phosphodiesterase class I)
LRRCPARGSKQLGLAVVAEGIENRATADFPVSMGCEEVQGYFFGRPMPADTLEKQFLAAELEAVSAA